MSFGSLKSLQYLIAGGNQLQQFDFNVIKQPKELKFMSLEGLHDFKSSETSLESYLNDNHETLEDLLNNFDDVVICE